MNNEEFEKLKIKFNKIAQAFSKFESNEGKYYYTDINGNELENVEIIKGLIYYFTNDGIMAANYGLDIRKSIRLVGNTGSGKTMILRIMAELFKSFKIYRTLDIVEDYDDNGNGILKKLGRHAIFLNAQKGNVILRNALFDDIGKEDQGRFFKTEKNVIAHIIDSRYDHWINYGLKTHFTDNLSDNELYNRYGDRIFGRITQMSNKIILGGKKDSIDFRKPIEYKEKLIG